MRRTLITATALAAFVGVAVSTVSDAFLSQSLLSASAPATLVAPTASLTCTSPSPCTISNGGTATLNWASNQPSCTSPDIPSFPGTGSGTISVSPTSTTPYHLTCGSATASATVTVTGGGGSVTCDIGPPYTGAIPAPATQAGFTHCAANFDFTYTQQFTDNVGTHTWSNLSTWFTCGNTTTAPFLMNYTAQNSDTACDTSHVNITTVGGIQVLQLTVSWGTDISNGHYNVSLQTADATGGTFHGTRFPQQFYVEQVLQTTNVDICHQSVPNQGNGCILYAIEFVPPDAYGGGAPCFVSGDFLEMHSPNGGGINGGLHYWNTSCPGGPTDFGPPTNPTPLFNSSGYTTYGILWTSDGTSQMGACNYSRTANVQGLTAGDFVNCLSSQTIVPPYVSTAIFSARHQLQFWEGPESNGQGGGQWDPNQNHTTTMPRTTMWTCSNPSAPCLTNPVITTHP